jgi:hypothetical protein
VTYMVNPVIGLGCYCAAFLGFAYLMLHPEVERRILLRAGLIQ